MNRGRAMTTRAIFFASSPTRSSSPTIFDNAMMMRKSEPTGWRRAISVSCARSRQ